MGCDAFSDGDEAGRGPENLGDVDLSPDNRHGELHWAEGHFAAFAPHQSNHVQLLVDHLAEFMAGERNPEVRMNWFSLKHRLGKCRGSEYGNGGWSLYF